MARKLQPSVVWIGDTEKTFYKKVPHAERKVSASQWILSGAFSLLPRGPRPRDHLDLSRRSCFLKGGRKQGASVPLP